MYNIDPPEYPHTMTDEHFRYTAKKVHGFAGLQTRNGPYGAVSSDGPSDGSVHFCSDNKGLSPGHFLEIVDWIDKNAEGLLDLALASLVEQYWEMRDIVIECLIDEDPDDVVPEITHHTDLRRLCGIAAVHVRGYGPDKTPRFGIEFGCTWEDEHGAGVRFEGMKVVKSGDADEAFTYE